MNRKFRVWDGKEMHEPPHDFLLSGDGVVWEGFGDEASSYASAVRLLKFEPMLSTGLTDSEGTKIWEGDIIGFKILGSMAHYLVAWHEKYGAWHCRAGNGEWMARLSVQLDKDDCTVNGNRHEDSELLGEPAK